MRPRSLNWSFGGRLTGMLLLAGCGASAVDPSLGTNQQAMTSENGLSTNGLSTNGLSTNGLSTNGLSTNGLSTNGLSTNGLSTNGLSTNGLSTNGLSTNGLSTNGLSTNGLSTNGLFATWFNTADGGNIAIHDEAMTYVIRCALAPDHWASFVDSAGVEHKWYGELALADDWTYQAPSQSEKTFISACLMAHVNSNGNHVQISVRGNSPGLAVGNAEAQALSHPNGAFFGDLFASPSQMFVCTNDDDYKRPNWSGSVFNTIIKDWGRECGVDGCAIMQVKNCDNLCQDGARGGGYPYSSCTVHGKTYNAVSAFIPKWKDIGGARVDDGARIVLADHALRGMAAAFERSNAGTIALDDVVHVAGDYVLEIRYSNGGNATATMNVLTEHHHTVAVSFPPTGGADVWAWVNVPVSLDASPSITLQVPGKNVVTPHVDAIAIRLP